MGVADITPPCGAGKPAPRLLIRPGGASLMGPNTQPCLFFNFFYALCRPALRLVGCLPFAVSTLNRVTPKAAEQHCYIVCTVHTAAACCKQTCPADAHDSTPLSMATASSHTVPPLTCQSPVWVAPWAPRSAKVSFVSLTPTPLHAPLGTQDQGCS